MSLSRRLSDTDDAFVVGEFRSESDQHVDNFGPFSPDSARAKIWHRLFLLRLIAGQKLI